MLVTRRSRTRKTAVWLENGYRLTSPEFLRRWKAFPQIKCAELIEGTVYMPPPLRADTHAEPDALIHLWLGYYAAQSAGVKLYANPTLVLDRENTPQPDSVLCRIPSRGGKAVINKDGYLTGAPELVCEVSSSSASLDMHAKFSVYRRCGIQEYIVWLTGEQRIHWFVLGGGEYVPLVEKSGLLKSQVFPALTLDVKAVLALNASRVLAVQQRYLKK